MKRSLLIMLMVLALVAMILSACGGPAATQASSDTTGGSTGGGEKVKIGLSFSDFATERWKREADQMTKLLQAKGYDVVVQEANHDVKLQNDQIDNMVAQGVKGLIVVAEDGDAAATSVDKAAKAGVKV